MKPFLTILSICSIMLLTSFKINSTYEIVNFYKGYSVDEGTKAISEDELKDVSVVLSPTKIQTGKYVVKISRIAKDVYKVNDKNIYIETKYSYEYATDKEVVLDIEGEYSYSKGKVIF